jgi:hypothetical protein
MCCRAGLQPGLEIGSASAGEAVFPAKPAIPAGREAAATREGEARAAYDKH